MGQYVSSNLHPVFSFGVCTFVTLLCFLVVETFIIRFLWLIKRKSGKIARQLFHEI